MKILYFIPRYDPALMGNRIHAEVIRAWREQGSDAEVLTLTSGIDRIVTEEQEGIVVHRLPASAGAASKLANRAVALALPYPYLAGAVRHYRRFIRRHRFDIVHIETSFPLGLVAALAPRSESPPLAVTLPGADIMAEPDYDYGYGRFRAVRALLPFIFRRARVLRADSPQIRTLAIRLGADPAKIVAIPYNITEDSYPPPECEIPTLRAQARAALDERHGLDPARPLVISLNRLHPFKGFSYVVEALAELKRRGLRPQAIFVGPNRATPRFGDFGAFLRQRAAELGVADDLIFAGAVPHEETLTYLAAADVNVIASVAESFSRVAIETAAAGTPLVITRTTGASDYIQEAGAGLVVESRSATALADAIGRLLSEPELWRQCSEAGPRMARDFHSTTIAHQLLSLYQEQFAESQRL